MSSPINTGSMLIAADSGDLISHKGSHEALVSAAASAWACIFPCMVSV